MSDFHVKIPCKATLGKRKVQSIDDGHDCMLTGSINPQTCYPGFHANLWLGDEDGRTMAIHLRRDALIELHRVLSDAIKKQETDYLL